ncbi:hypothetical protein DM2_107 [Halorubrum sp. DM2]|uniref:DUF1641 domain-containing protein n=1 Tax=Halorubrum sp. DM2 TaxID=2527867 RepID=UPI0024B6BE18|nr:DUF1641 domain-containing protein [Halorubrum sp. DM2]VTT85225.1 hypothetical protein DM2_107 [Halorubrum sp. DM2]
MAGEGSPDDGTDAGTGGDTGSDAEAGGDEEALDPADLDRDELAAVVAENPEAVAGFVDRLDAVNELLDVVALGEGALTDEMAVELAGTASTLAESADGLATDETARLAATVGENGDDLREAIETLIELQRSGTLDELAELGGVGSLATAALDDEMVRSLAATGSSLGEVADAAADGDARDGLATLLQGVGAAQRSEPQPVGAVGLARGVRDPEVKYGVGYLLAVAKAIGRERGQAAEE